MEKKEIKERLKTSLEMDTIKATSLLVTIITLVFSVFAYFRYIDTYLGPLPFCFTGGIMLGPMCLYHGWVIWKMFRKAEFYKFYRVKLAQPRSGFWRDTMYFQVLLQDAEGTVITQTRSIFYTHGLMGPLMGDYVNRDATIAYNPETGQVVVIG